MLTDHPPRPCWNHKCVKEAAAYAFVDPIREWAEGIGAVTEGVDDKQFLALLSLALIESSDSYQAARYLEDFLDWPVTLELLKILEAAFHRMKYITRDLTHTWVMEHNIRIPAEEGNMIRCKIGDLEVTGRLCEVVKREARGFFIPNGHVSYMTVYAEEILQVVPERTLKQDAPPTDGST